MARPTLVNLETALWVERIGSFSGAARRLNASQPAIALRIRELEASLNFRIFVRRGAQMLPTPEGREFLDRIEPLVRELQSVLGEANTEPTSGSVVRVGAGQVAVAWLARVLRTLIRDAANVRYEVTVERVPTLIVLLEQEKVDLGLLPVPIQHPKLDCIPAGKDAMVWVMGAERVGRFLGYAKLREPPLVDLLNNGPLWMPHKTSPYFQSQSELLRERGAHLRNINVCSDILRVADFVAATGGIGYIPRSLVAERLKTQELVPVQGLPDGEALFYAIKRRSDNRATLRRLIEMIQIEGTGTSAKRRRSKA